MKNIILEIIGRILHYISYRKENKGPVENALVLMSGPSNELDDFSDKLYSVSIASNLTSPEGFKNKVKSKIYYHCFSDPSILTDQNKFKIFGDIIKYAKENDDYKILLPIQYLKNIKIYKIIFNRNVIFYNQNMSYQKKQGIRFDKYTYPNMNTILLDCALPWVSFLGAKNIFVSGFDANYGNDNSKKYSNINLTHIEENTNRSLWSDEVKFNAQVMTKLIEKTNGCKVNFSINSGFWKYMNENTNCYWKSL
ncbi:hypothetical protein V9N52_003549 [Vibrio navarrensis]